MILDKLSVFFFLSRTVTLWLFFKNLCLLKMYAELFMVTGI